jgi:hypothetical protein
MPRTVVGVACFLMLAVAGCGGEVREPAGGQTSPPVEDVNSADRVTYRSTKWGYTVTFPASWQRAERPISRITDPREILSLGTFPLRHRPTNCDAFAGSARQDLGTSDAFLTVMERGFNRNSEWLDFPPRPQQFSATPENTKGPDPACGDRPKTNGHWINFTDAGRRFHVHIVLGADAPASVRDDVWKIVNSLTVDPNVKPDWPASP